MIVYDKLWKTMEKKGVSTYFLREKAGIDSKTVRRLKANENMETKQRLHIARQRRAKHHFFARYRVHKTAFSTVERLMV